MENTGNECKNCHNHFKGNYCNNCGQKSGVKRFTLSNLLKVFLDGFLHMKSGLLFTIKELFVRPGEVLREYIAGKRVKYFNPFSYLVLISMIVGYLYGNSGIIEQLNLQFMVTKDIITFTREHFSSRLLMAIPTYSLTCWALFRSFKYNLAEHLIIITFLVSQSFLIMMVWLLIFSIVKPENIEFVIYYYSSFASLFIYQVVALFHLFNKGNLILRWTKATMAVLVGFGSSFVVIYYVVKIMKLF